MTEDRNGKTYELDLCKQCKQSCCRDANPPLTIRRRQLISQFFKQHSRNFKNVIVEEEYCHPVTDDERICIFFDKHTQKCSIHPIKPETCRAGPITFDINLLTGKVEWFIKKSEICALAETLLRNPSRLRAHFEIAKKELTRLISELDATSIQAVLRIEEPQTDRIGENRLPEEILDKLINLHS